MYRKELKYIINRNQQEIIERKLKLFCNYDANSPEDGKYTVSSLYFDDYINSAFEDKISGIIDRKKFRIRIYNGSDKIIKLERKIKRVNAVKKDFAFISRNEYNKILKGKIFKCDDSTNPVKNDFILMQKSRGLKPAVVVTYNRTSYVYSYGNIRIVFDSNIRTTIGSKNLFDSNPSVTLMDPSQIIMEVKYTGYLPDIIKKSIQHGQGNMQAFSKFSTCMKFIK